VPDVFTLPEGSDRAEQVDVEKSWMRLNNCDHIRAGTSVTEDSVQLQAVLTHYDF